MIYYIPNNKQDITDLINSNPLYEEIFEHRLNGSCSECDLYKKGKCTAGDDCYHASDNGITRINSISSNSKSIRYVPGTGSTSVKVHKSIQLFKKMSKIARIKCPVCMDNNLYNICRVFFIGNNSFQHSDIDISYCPLCGRKIDDNKE